MFITATCQNKSTDLHALFAVRQRLGVVVPQEVGTKAMQTLFHTDRAAVTASLKSNLYFVGNCWVIFQL